MTVKFEIYFDSLTEAATLFAQLRSREIEFPVALCRDSAAEKLVYPEVSKTVVEVAPEAVIAEPVKEKKPRKAKVLEVAAPAGEPTVVDVRTALAALLGSKGAKACSELLEKYRVTRISEIPVVDYGAFIAECVA